MADHAQLVQSAREWCRRTHTGGGEDGHVCLQGSLADAVEELLAVTEPCPGCERPTADGQPCAECWEASYG